MYWLKKHALAALLLPFFISCGNAGITVSSREFPADGFSSGTIVLRKDFSNITDRIIIPENDLVEIIGKDHSMFSETIFFRSSGREGELPVLSESGDKLKLTFYKNQADIDYDGFPDEAELNAEEDRLAFRRWMIRIAESQALKRSDLWEKRERDCAGFVRFCYREAMKRHDEQWFRKMGISTDKNIPDIKKFLYPKVPVVGSNIFRTVSGFSPFANAEAIMKYNCRLTGREVQDAEPGDLLFFYNPDNRENPHHSMIVTGKGVNGVTVIYHTGSDDEIKMVPLSYLSGSQIFRPVSWNKNFLGVFRLLILD